jgi:hypothetical protein
VQLIWTRNRRSGARRLSDNRQEVKAGAGESGRGAAARLDGTAGLGGRQGDGTVKCVGFPAVPAAPGTGHDQHDLAAPGTLGSREVELRERAFARKVAEQLLNADLSARVDHERRSVEQPFHQVEFVLAARVAVKRRLAKFV